MRIIFLILALFVCGCAAVPPECHPVIIGPSQFEYVASQLVGANNGGATLISPDFSKLYDGHPSTDTRFEYVSGGLQTISSVWAIEVGVGQEGSDVPGNVTVGNAFILHTSMPAGAHVEIHAGTLGGTLLASGTMQLDQSGVTTSAILLWENELDVLGIFFVAFPNNVGGSTYLGNGSQIDIGEIHFSESVIYPLKRTPKIGWAQINKQRFTSSGLTLPVLQPQVRTLQMELAPLAQAEAVNSGAVDLMTVFYRIMQGTVSAFVPFVTRDEGLYGPQTYTDLDSLSIRSKTAMLASFSQSPSLGMDAAFYWDSMLNVTESI